MSRNNNSMKGKHRDEPENFPTMRDLMTEVTRLLVDRHYCRKCNLTAIWDHPIDQQVDLANWLADKDDIITAWNCRDFLEEWWYAEDFSVGIELKRLLEAIQRDKNYRKDIDAVLQPLARNGWITSTKKEKSTKKKGKPAKKTTKRKGLMRGFQNIFGSTPRKLDRMGNTGSEENAGGSPNKPQYVKPTPEANKSLDASKSLIDLSCKEAEQHREREDNWMKPSMVAGSGVSTVGSSEDENPGPEAETSRRLQQLMEYLVRTNNDEGVRRIAKQQAQQWAYMAGETRPNPEDSGKGPEDMETEGTGEASGSATGGSSAPGQVPATARARFPLVRSDSDSKIGQAAKRRRDEVDLAGLTGTGLDITQTTFMDIVELNEKIHMWEAAWEVWGSNDNNIGKRPYTAATTKVTSLMGDILKPLLKSYKELTREVQYMRRAIMDTSKLQHAVESLDQIALGLKEVTLRDQVVEETILPGGQTERIMSSIQAFHQSIMAKFGELEEKLSGVDNKADMCSGKIDMLQRHDIKALSNKVELVKRKLNGGKIGRAFAEDKIETLGAGSTVHERSAEETAATTDWETEEGDNDNIGNNVRKKKTKKERDAEKKRADKMKIDRAIERTKAITPSIERSIIVRLPKDSPSLDVEMQENDQPGSHYRDALMSSPPTIKRQMKAVIEPRSMALNVDAVVPAGKTGLRVTAADKQQARQIANTLTNKGFTVTNERMPDRPILVKVYRVDRLIPREEVATYVYDQNPWIRERVKELGIWQGMFEPKFMVGRKTLADGKTPAEDCIWVVKVGEKLRQELLRREFLYIGMERCRVLDFIEVTRCYTCQGYGHSSSSQYCPGTHRCGLCAGDHDTKTCPLKDVQPPIDRKCVNCKLFNMPNDHPVDDQNCPAYQRALRRYLARINPSI